MIELSRIVGWDAIAQIPITAADVEYDLAAIARIIDHPAADWCRPVLLRRQEQLKRLLEE